MILRYFQWMRSQGRLHLEDAGWGRARKLYARYALKACGFMQDARERPWILQKDLLEHLLLHIRLSQIVLELRLLELDWIYINNSLLSTKPVVLQHARLDHAKLTISFFRSPGLSLSVQGLHIITAASNPSGLRHEVLPLYNEDIDTSGDYKKLLLAYLNNYRPETPQVNMQLAHADCMELYRAGEGRLGTDEAAIMVILSSRSSVQLNACFNLYKQTYGHDIEEEIWLSY
ncbi:hypothetical protein L7F22_048264 [Adiantum nelumboides]|nr:hypothetical protein [Adiantum nelumboides]